MVAQRELSQEKNQDFQEKKAEDLQRKAGDLQRKAEDLQKRKAARPSREEGSKTLRRERQ